MWLLKEYKICEFKRSNSNLSVPSPRLALSYLMSISRPIDAPSPFLSYLINETERLIEEAGIKIVAGVMMHDDDQSYLLFISLSLINYVLQNSISFQQGKIRENYVNQSHNIQGNFFIRSLRDLIFLKRRQTFIIRSKDVKISFIFKLICYLQTYPLLICSVFIFNLNYFPQIVSK